MPIRKANPYRRMQKAIATNNYHDNILNREFYEVTPGEHLLTDITYIYYGPNKTKAYLSTIKDAATREILAYKVSKNLYRLRIRYCKSIDSRTWCSSNK